MRPTSARAGYAMMLVLVFIVLFLSLLAVGYRQTATALRIESVRSQATQRDEGSIQALALALALLETGNPPSDPYVCGATIDTSTGAHSYTVTFTSEGTNNWSVNSAPTLPSDNPQPMPSSFLPP